MYVRLGRNGVFSNLPPNEHQRSDYTQGSWNFGNTCKFLKSHNGHRKSNEGGTCGTI